MLAYTGLGSGDRVVDSGTGAGAIALNFGNVVGDTGKVYTYEIREDFAKVAQKKTLKLLESIILKLKTKILRKESMNKTLIWSF